MSGDSVSIKEIKALVNNYNVILAKYLSTNKSLTDLGLINSTSNVNKRVYYLNQLGNLNTQLTQVNDQIIAKITTINSSGDLTTLYNERKQFKEQLDTLSQQLNASLHNSNPLDLEYVQQDSELETNSQYYMFLSLTMICLIALIVIFTMHL